ncbi:ABC transporter ATP-binding protein [Risungbinella massiliensis]|uniref:ABC transporter ATP-binding protein n=1 Tax=Risungbinella massiliensis TaxID=1329796 RepID=UPI0005CBB3DA|nr:ABC transporter ATP-binding protein [Risungbinella massiliensis]
MQLHTEGLTIRYANHDVVHNLHLEVPIGKITALVGSNGSGKSTILKTIARILTPRMGTVYLDGKSIHNLPSKQVAQQLAILPQTPEAPEGTTVEQLVGFGRFPYLKGIRGLSSKDREIINWAIERTGLDSFRNQPIDELSGGQRQRAWIAMALAQDTEILLLDEPTTYLDMAHQHEVLLLLQKLNEEQERTIVMVVHDLNHASRFAHHMISIHNGGIYSQGSPDEVMTTDMLRNVFRIDADIIQDPRLKVPLCIPYEVLSNEQEKTKVAVG